MSISSSPTESLQSSSSHITSPCTTLTGREDVKTSTTTDFWRWRPSYHLIAPSGWMNDPCALTYDASTGLYHVYFQWNPKSHDWGDIVWGAAVSKNMVDWTIADEPALSIDRPYDHKGVFTGCMMPSPAGNLTCAYTSVSALPIHHTLAHPRGSESLSMAESNDGGRTWSKLDCNPVLPSEPENLDVTGWRDPFVASWPRMCQVLGRDPATSLFGIISGGIRDITPTTFLYSINKSDLTKWEYICPLIQPGLNLRPSRWSGDLGRNWEVTNFLTLKDETDSSIERDFLVMGTEGCISDQDNTSSIGPTRPVRGQLWMSGSLQKDDENPVAMSYNFGGHLDHGCFYAANSFFDPSTQRQVIYGWITEDDLCDELRAKQGWSGLLSLPRELRLQTIRHVTGAFHSNLDVITSIETEKDSDYTRTVRTLCSPPVKNVVTALRTNANIRQCRIPGLIGGSLSSDHAFTSDDLQTNQWELECSFKVSRQCSRVGIVLEHSKDPSQNTTLTFSPHEETFTIERPAFQSTSSPSLLNSKTETAPHTLFTSIDPAHREKQGELEPLEVQIFRDASVLEVFINGGRTVISTRIYAADQTLGIRFFAVDELNTWDATDVRGSANHSRLLCATLYDGIGTKS